MFQGIWRVEDWKEKWYFWVIFRNLRDCSIESRDLVGEWMCWAEWEGKVKMLEFVGEFTTY